jgi:hypothetical protein
VVNGDVTVVHSYNARKSGGVAPPRKRAETVPANTKPQGAVKPQSSPGCTEVGGYSQVATCAFDERSETPRVRTPIGITIASLEGVLDYRTVNRQGKRRG